MRWEYVLPIIARAQDITVVSLHGSIKLATHLFSLTALAKIVDRAAVAMAISLRGRTAPPVHLLDRSRR